MPIQLSYPLFGCLKSVPTTAGTRRWRQHPAVRTHKALRPAPPGEPYLLRPHRPGDIGWVVARHAAFYADEQAIGTSFEALVARIAAGFIERFDAQREACWIAERDGANVGSVFLVQARDEATHRPVESVAQLRMLLVEPSARGLGLGKQPIEECERFARHAGHRKIVLWTQASLLGVRGIYGAAGYGLTSRAPHHSFGQDLVGETWERVSA